MNDLGFDDVDRIDLTVHLKNGTVVQKTYGTDEFAAVIQKAIEEHLEHLEKVGIRR